ncbi:MAG: DUF2975 domain-containing protein [Flavobacterium sp.]|nr:DUF2975 domain-containing protein [Flavobacterium sp.]
MYLFSADFDIPIVINGQTIEETRWSAKVVAIFAGLGGILFFYGIFLLRKILILFQQRQIFVDSIVQNFYRIGYCVIGSGLLTNVPIYFYNIIERGNFKIEIVSGGFDSFILSISLGLLFMVIAEIFKHAKVLKEENELTV